LIEFVSQTKEVIKKSAVSFTYRKNVLEELGKLISSTILEIDTNTYTCCSWLVDIAGPTTIIVRLSRDGHSQKVVLQSMTHYKTVAKKHISKAFDVVDAGSTQNAVAMAKKNKGYD